MDHVSNSLDNLHSSQSDVQIETEVSIISEAIDSTSSLSNATVPKTARDKFFKDLQSEPEKT